MDEKNITQPRSATLRPLPSVKELREALKASEASDTRDMIRALFDTATFSELGVYAKRSFSEYAYTGITNDFEGVICGYGAIDGRLVYAFAQDMSRMQGAMDDRHAAKIVALYEAAISNGAPVIGIFNSTGADIYEGVSSLAAYGRVMKAVAAASGRVPQIAVIAGDCMGIAASLAAMYDFTIAVRGTAFYIHAPDFNAEEEQNEILASLTALDKTSAMEKARQLIRHLPDNAEEGIVPMASSDDLNRLLGHPDFNGSLRNLLGAVADNGVFDELTEAFAPSLVTAFTTIGGIRCGVIGNRDLEADARLGADEARKAAHFVNFLDAFSIPLVTFVDSAGLAFCQKKEDTRYASALAALAFAFAKSTMPKITVILGKAIGGAYTLLGAKAMGADVVYALETAEIGALSADAAVAFAWNHRITLDTTREELENEWRTSLSSPVAAACRGEVDDIITVNEMRQRIASALQMLTLKGTVRRRHTVTPL